MTNQEAFDIVVKHLLTQKVQSYNFGAGCRYRGVEGRKCAVGILIPDDVYKPEMENTRIDVLMQRPEKWGLEYLKDVNLDLLCRLQNVHDYEEEEMWAQALEGLAAMFGLEFNPPEDYTAEAQEPTSHESRRP